eukprot:357954-Rhodomonas_salina.3
MTIGTKIVRIGMAIGTTRDGNRYEDSEDWDDNWNTESVDWDDNRHPDSVDWADNRVTDLDQLEQQHAHTVPATVR